MPTKSEVKNVIKQKKEESEVYDENQKAEDQNQVTLNT